MAQRQQLGGHRGLAARHLRKPAEHPNCGQVQQPNNHAPHLRQRSENPSSHRVRAVLARYRHMKRAMANFAVTGVEHLLAVAKNRLKRIQYRPELLDGFLAQTGLSLDPAP